MVSAVDEKRHVEDMGKQCKSCTGRSFRRSRLKLKDLWSLLVLHYPVRCLSCSIRQTVTLPVAMRSYSSKLKQVRAKQGNEGGSTEEGLRPKGPSIVGGKGFQVLPVREPMVMPDLQGVTLKHISSLPMSDEKQAR